MAVARQFGLSAGKGRGRIRAIGKRRHCKLLETPKPPVAIAGAIRCLGALARPRALAAMVLGTIAALLAALALACTPASTATPTPSVPAAPTPAPAASPAPATDLMPFVQMAVGKYSQCGLLEEGRALCPKEGLYVRTPEAGRFRQVSIGQEYACGLRLDGTIACWGNSEHGKTTPPPGKFTAIAAGKQHACARDAAGYAQCWGWDKDGRTKPPSGLAFTAIAAGGVHSCGLTAKGQLRCWGKNALGQAEDHDGPFQSLTLGLRNTCALRPDGTAWCQGDNANGQSRPPPGEFTQIAAGGWQTCGIRPGGQLECWGGGFGVELEEPEGAFTAISAGWNTFCALTAAGYPRCWDYSLDSKQAMESTTTIVAAEVATTPLRQPADMFLWPGGLAVVEREGRILLCQRRGDDHCAGGAKPLLDLTEQTDLSASESGMLSAAADPDFNRFPFIYVWYTVIGEPRKGRLSRFPVVDGLIDPAGELVMLEQPMPNVFHFGGAARFGPDNMLYLSLGENLISAAAQNRESLLGKIIRIDVRGASPEQPYRIPADNPFLTIEGARPEIWAYGLRNPWRMSFDVDGRLWVGDVGSIHEEEVSIVAAGDNLGWPAFEGKVCLIEAAQCAALPEYRPPVATYGRDEICAIIWAGQYQGSALPQLAGSYIFGDFCSGRIWALTPNLTPDGESGWSRRLVAITGSPILSFGTDAAGEMYILSVDRPLLKLLPALAAGPTAENPAAGP